MFWKQNSAGKESHSPESSFCFPPGKRGGLGKAEASRSSSLLTGAQSGQQTQGSIWLERETAWYMCGDGGGKRVKEEVRWCERRRPVGV